MALNDWTLTLSSNQNTVSFETSLALQVEETSTCCSAACKISIFLLWLAAPKCHRNKGQCPQHYYHDPNPVEPQADSMGLTCGKEWRKTHENTWCWNNKNDQRNWSTGLKDDAQLLQAQNHDSSWSPLATLVCHKLISRLVLQGKHVAIGLSTFVKFLSAWFWIWHLHFLSMKTFQHISIREVWRVRICFVVSIFGKFVDDKMLLNSTPLMWSC